MKPHNASLCMEITNCLLLDLKDGKILRLSSKRLIDKGYFEARFGGFGRICRSIGNSKRPCVFDDANGECEGRASDLFVC